MQMSHVKKKTVEKTKAQYIFIREMSATVNKFYENQIDKKIDDLMRISVTLTKLV